MNNSVKKQKKLLSVIALSISISLSMFSNAYAAFPSIPTDNNTEKPSLAPMLETVLPSVVSIKVEGVAQMQNNMPEEFRRFFGYPDSQSRAFTGQGSGVIIDAEKGYVVTNNHVIENADKIIISLNDGHEYQAKLIGKDQQSDIALLQIQDGKKLTALKLADSDKLRVGDYVVAIGNPFGIGQTVTSGIISALARSGLSMNGFENFIQTDASINRGNSGGALVNLNGELVGINTAIIAPSGGNVGIGFAIPSNMVKNLTSQLIEFGEVKRGVLGIKGNELTSDIAKAFDLEIQKGAFVSEVIDDSAAKEAGIKSGDVIVSMDGKPVDSFAELRAKIATAGVGRTVELGLIRDGKNLTVSVKLKNSDESTTEAKSLHASLDGAILTNGEIKGQKGVIIESIAKNSPASSLSLQEGDLITGVNKTRVNNIADLRKIIDSKPSAIALNIVRGDSRLYLILR
ncbi:MULTISPECIES: Do family serine endopeptidase [unclassified Gilliamella]|uniref:Do family serine endopeptidase n=1 Tax=unclassified Gilliamella TaxID=2685620 RepID=UPI002A02528C|nr:MULTISPECIES: Do family serine endopeptidase [unclassified Gilliamella]MCX8575225.1 Do family serine endopeptidase [Gilliamella sp. B3831]MCX8577608.1 Do family serine endopeptidase [Gilliamella sp. B3815]MCX8579285.1 Do family serine endopeptidase [Gilliamella sp. B2717]MCX8588675.1 Do family serine endopeptidase [Gilliamella sp. B3801]MCX8590288.1 Do family serine endopeptidase [Gilliamella sp. B3812]